MGFCRERQNCPYFHATKVCQAYFNSSVSSKQTCFERHPRRCIYFDRGKCQWDSQCKYLHKGRNNVQKDDEDSHKHDEESIESIMVKAKAFKLDESVLDEEDHIQNEERILILKNSGSMKTVLCTLCDYTVVPNSWISVRIYRTVVWSVVLR